MVNQSFWPRLQKMIRQTITCDVCGVHKIEANHWFMAFEHKGTLKLSAWGALNRVRPDMKHLCGEKCVHRLLDEFLAGSMNRQAGSEAPVEITAPRHRSQEAEVQDSNRQQATSGKRQAASSK
jgi:hypothetical protein